MANDNTRDVALNLRVNSTGTEAVPKLGKDLHDLGKQAAGSTPELEALAAEGERLAVELDAATAATKRYRDAEADAKGEVRTARRDLEDKRDALRVLRTETDSTSKKTAEYQAREQALKLEIIDANTALRTKRETVEVAGEATRRAVTAEGDLATRLAAVNAQQRDAAASALNLGRAQQQSQAAVRDGLTQIASQLRTIQSLAGAALGGSLLGGMVGDVVRTTDAWANLSARLRIVVGDGAALGQSLQGVVDIATRTGTALEETGTLFGRLAQAGKDAGLTTQQATQQALGLTESINQAVQISGASAEASSAAVTQFVQAMQSGVLRGEEFNSVMEQAPRLARALADGLGVTVGELRKLAEAGQLTSQTVITALQGQSATLQAEFEKLPPTVGRALQNLSTNWTAYIGQVDQANGISATAARAINALASNLDVLASGLLAAGKVAAAYQALQLGKTFLEAATGARASAGAIAAETVAVSANTSAKVANKAASIGAAEGMAAAATSAGRLASILSGLKTFTLLGLLTSARDVGTWLGETAAKSVGYRDRTKEIEAADKAAALAAREHAQSVAALAQQQQIAENKALGLTTQARALVAEFENARTKGDSVAEALGKVSKSLDIGSLQGIKDAGVALDALALKGTLTAQQVRDALAKSLGTADLAIFEATARAAFDGTVRGAERLAAAIDAGMIEALRRAGTSVQELQTGFSATANTAINNFDALAASIDRLNAKGPEVGRALAGSLDQALNSANTERAIQAVIDRWQALGQQGIVTGDQLAAGLAKARAKLDELRPGISSLDEALKTFGLKSRAELQRTADAYGQAWAQISTSTTTSLADKARAFEQFKAAATAANMGILPTEIRVQEEMLRVQLQATDAGRTIAEQMDRAGVRVDALADRVGALGGRLATIVGEDRTVGNAYKGGDAQVVDNSGLSSLVAKRDSGTLSAADLATAKVVLDAARFNAVSFDGSGRSTGASFDPTFRVQRDAMVAQEIVDQIEQMVRGAKTSPSQATSHKVEIKLGRSSATVNTASADDSDALVGILKQLQDAKARA